MLMSFKSTHPQLPRCYTYSHTFWRVLALIYSSPPCDRKIRVKHPGKTLHYFTCLNVLKLPKKYWTVLYAANFPLQRFLTWVYYNFGYIILFHFSILFNLHGRTEKRILFMFCFHLFILWPHGWIFLSNSSICTASNRDNDLFSKDS